MAKDVDAKFTFLFAKLLPLVNRRVLSLRRRKKRGKRHTGKVYHEEDCFIHTEICFLRPLKSGILVPTLYRLWRTFLVSGGPS